MTAYEEKPLTLHEAPRMGRRRKEGLRWTSGGRAQASEPSTAMGYWRRAKTLAMAEIIQPRWGSAIAQLMFYHRLTDREVAAADRWAEWRGRYDRLKGYERRSCASPLYETGYGRSNGHGKELSEADAKFCDQFDNARKAVLAVAGIMGLSVLDDTSVLNESVGNDMRLERLRAVLRALLVHWGM